MCCLMSPAVPGSPRCCWPSWGLAAPSVPPQLQLFLWLAALASGTIFMYTTRSKALITPHRGCFAALSHLSFFVLPKSLPCLLVLFSLPLAPCPEIQLAGTPSLRKGTTCWVPWRRHQVLVKIVECNGKYWGFSTCAQCRRRQILRGKILSVI